MKKTISLFLLLGGFFLSGLTANAQNTLSLPEMDLSLAYQQYGSPMKNMAVTGETLTIAGEQFNQGIGVQANSKIKLSLRKNTSLFTCKVGVNDHSLDYKKEDFSKMTESIVTYLKRCATMIEKNDYHRLDDVIAESVDLTNQLTALKKGELKRIQGQSGSTKVSMVYLNMVQEAQNIVSFTANLIKVSRKFQKE